MEVKLALDGADAVDAGLAAHLRVPLVRRVGLRARDAAHRSRRGMIFTIAALRAAARARLLYDWFTVREGEAAEKLVTQHGERCG